jgi:beta-phosphoglucomutase-like phosphatase (HAD superfamily)
MGNERGEIVEELFKDDVNFIPGFIDFYEKIKTDFKSAVATSLQRNFLEDGDKRLHLLKLFNGNVFSISDIGLISKPNPDIFLYAARKLNSPPENCLVIEDAPNGIESAKRAKMKCIAITTTFDRSKLTEADQIVNSYSEINL